MIFYPHTLTLTLTTETPINRAFQTNCEGVRVEKEKKFFIINELSDSVKTEKTRSFAKCARLSISSRSFTWL